MLGHKSRLNDLLESSSQARRFSSNSYQFRPSRGRRFDAPTIRPWESSGRHLLSNALPVPTDADSEWQSMEQEIKEAVYILAIKNEEDCDDFVPYTRETFDRATKFLTRQMIHAHSARVAGIGIPRICPADHGSIDLFWEKGDQTLLINFPPSGGDASYYGKKPKSEISGRFDPSEARIELISWLADQ